LVWLFDHRGGYALLMIDARSGESREIVTPFPPGGDCPYASILSRSNKYYTHFNSHFVEFDPTTAQFTACHATVPQMAMSMTEDDRGVIWSTTYPHSGLVSYDPSTRTFTDFGHLHKENWLQYPRHIVVDDAGWVYIGVGNTASNILAFDPSERQVKHLTSDVERVQGEADVYRNRDGKVYGHHPGQDNWYRFHAGTAVRIDQHSTIDPVPIVTGSQGLFHREFPDGSSLLECDLVERTMTVRDGHAGETRELAFDYSSEGAHIMSIAASPDGTICGGTAFPMRFFRFDPRTDQWTNRSCFGQWNTVASQGTHFFVGGYGHGFLLDWDPSRPWIGTERESADSNPRFLTQCEPTINRPHDLLAHTDGQTLILAGTPGYGFTGGGLLFWDRETSERVVLEHTDIIPELSTSALVSVDQNTVLGGTTTAPGTGGEKKAEEAELYLLNLNTKRVEWHQAVLPGVQQYTDLCRGPGKLVYGIADRSRLFVFDTVSRQVFREEVVSHRFGPTNSQQGPRVFVADEEGNVYLLFVKGIGRVDAKSHEVTMLAESPVPIGPGGDVLRGRIYFGSGSHLYSYALPNSQTQ
jgi:hypothetical protein